MVATFCMPLSKNSLSATLAYCVPSLQARNEMVLWDKIIPQPEDAVLSLSGSFAKYPIIDQHTDLRGRTLNLTLHWDVMPYTGILYFGSSSTQAVALPAEYCTDATCSFEML